jgi:hypothetical protein
MCTGKGEWDDGLFGLVMVDWEEGWCGLEGMSAKDGREYNGWPEIGEQEVICTL